MAETSSKTLNDLPLEIIEYICEALARNLDYASLFNFAQSEKLVSRPALKSLYSIHQHISFRGGQLDQAEMAKVGDVGGIVTEQTRNAQQITTISKWINQWQSIILSSMEKTLFPYCLYLQCLDIENLEHLLDDTKHRERFFVGDVERYWPFTQEPAQKRTTRTSKRSRVLWNMATVIEPIAEDLTKYTSVKAEQLGGVTQLEELHGFSQLSNTALSTWASRLPKLKYLRVWDGVVLTKMLGEALSANCPEFSQLNIYLCSGDDIEMSLFLGALPKDSLNTMMINSINHLSQLTFQALWHHAESLQHLRIGSLNDVAMQNLHFLNKCTALQTLQLEDDKGRRDLLATDNDVFLGVTDWLSNCKRMKSIRLTNFVNGPKLMLALCASEDVKLSELTLWKYDIATGLDSFHHALALQTSLETLELYGNVDISDHNDPEVFVDLISKLQNLKHLRLKDISDYFCSDHIAILAHNLQQLEYFEFNGMEANDSIFEALRNCRYLRSLNINAASTLTSHGILEYIEGLSKTNSGLLLAVTSAREESDLSINEIETINEAIAAKVGGRFEFTPIGVPNLDGSSSEDFSD